MDGRADGVPARKVNCPQCGRPSVYGPANPFRPFCTERCRLLDLGQWANESYRVPSESGPESDAESDERG